MRRTLILVSLTIAIIVSASTLARASTQSYQPDANAPRASIPKAFLWDTTPLFANDGAWSAATREVGAKLTAFGRHQGKLTSAEAIRVCLDDFVVIRKLMDRIGLYANLKNAEDENVERYQQLRQQGLTIMKRFMEATSFLKEEILALDDTRIQQFLATETLAPYRNAISEMRRRRAHLLTPEAERVMMLAGDNLFSEVDLNELPSDVELVFKAVQRDLQLPKIQDENGKEVQLTLANYGKYRQSKDRRVRRDAVEGFLAALKKYEDICAATLGGEIKRDTWLARARNYTSAAEAYLDGDNVPPAVIDNLIATVNRNLKPLHRYVELRKKLLTLPEVRLYDLYTPLIPAAAQEIPYDEAVQDILEAVTPLGSDYSEALTSATLPGSGWVDVYPNKGKESGAFSSSIWGVHPFVKLNYQNTVDDASTAAHEFGHALHSFLNAKANSYMDAGYSTFLAEIASTLNERLLLQYLLNKPHVDDQTKLYLLGELLERIRTTIYRQTLFAEFERTIHGLAAAGTPITAELLTKHYAELIKKYYGPGFTMGPNDGVEWAYIPHFYWKFYVFSYATGLSSGIALADRVAKGDTAARDAYLALLKEPAITPPIEALKKTGLDLTKPIAIEEALKLMDTTITEIDRIAGKHGSATARPTGSH